MSQRLSMIKNTWKAVRNRGGRPLKDGGLLLGSSVLPIRLRSFGNQHEVENCVVEDNLGDLVALGSSAAELSGRVPAELTVKKPFREGRVEDLDASRRLLKKLITGSQHRVLFGPRLVVGVASHLSSLERRTIVEVVKASGARQVTLVDCCILSLIGQGRDPGSVEGHLVVDLGAGHGEVALVSSGRVQALRTVHEIGNRLDQAIMVALREQMGIEISPQQAEKLKISLGTALRPKSEDSREVAGCDATTGLPSSVVVSNHTVYEAIRPFLLEIADEIRQILKTAPAGFISDIAKSRPILVGGVAKLTGLKQFLEEETRVSYELDDKPEEVTQRGLDTLLHDPDVRRRLLMDRKALPSGLRGRGRMREKLVGLLAVALILVASYFPAGENGFSTFDYWDKQITSMYNYLKPPAAAAMGNPDSAERAELQRRLGELEENNERLRSLTDLRNSPPGWVSDESMSALVIARPPTSWSQELLINAGQDQGVSPGMVVTTSEGLLGRVGQVKKSSSHVELIGQDSESFGGRVKRTSSGGVIEPGSNGRYTLTYIDPHGGVKVGDLVETAGLDGLYPSGVPLGKVVQLVQGRGEAFLTAEIEPAVKLGEVKSVVLIGQRS